MKSLNSNTNKIDRGHWIPDNDEDFNRINYDEDNVNWRTRTIKEIQSLLKRKFGDFYPKYCTRPKGCKFFSLCMYYELKYYL